MDPSFVRAAPADEWTDADEHAAELPLSLLDRQKVRRFVTSFDFANEPCIKSRLDAPRVFAVRSGVVLKSRISSARCDRAGSASRLVTAAVEHA